MPNFQKSQSRRPGTHCAWLREQGNGSDYGRLVINDKTCPEYPGSSRILQEPAGVATFQLMGNPDLH